MALVREQHAERRKMRWEPGDHDRGDAQVARNGHRMKRPGAARGDKREIAGIIALLDGDLAHGQRHLGDGDIHNRPRRRLRLHT